jgi:hypothetical protein
MLIVQMPTKLAAAAESFDEKCSNFINIILAQEVLSLKSKASYYY